MPSFSDLPKTYDPSAVEDEIYTAWEASGVFNPDHLPARNQSGDPYCIVMPPPNRTGTLHMGHATMLAIEDVMIRFHRMLGKRALWVPGTDHAAIATQVKVEQLLMKQGMKDPRKELGREVFLEKVKAFAEESASTIRHQIRKMGSSCDWSREKYTFDEERNRAVNVMFKRMFDDGIIERGYRIVNWDPQFQTTLSDDEVLTKEVTAKLLTFTYDKDFPIAISTTRPETKFGDMAVAVHPNDERYQQYVGQIFTPIFCGKKLLIKVIADESVDPSFGTGALGVTPAHSIIDAEMAARHGLETVIVIGKDGRLLPEVGSGFVGLTVEDARKKIEETLSASGLLISVEEIPQNLPIAERGGAPVEQLPMEQWFIRVNKSFILRQDTLGKWKKGDRATLKELMIHAVKSGQTKIVPERFEKTYFHWIENLRDWCISRQIWFGHRIPVWYRKSGEEIAEPVPSPRGISSSRNDESEMIVSATSPGEGWEQDPDTLDTWFSSGLWTFSTLGWPQTRVILVRHGQSQFNVQGRLDDQTNTSENGLTETGQQQILELAHTLKGSGAVKIFASPIRRARESAEILSRELGLEITFDERLREIGVGSFSGKMDTDFQAVRGSSVDAWRDAAPDGIEPFTSLKKRTTEFLDEARKRHAGETIIVVSHGDTISTLSAYGTDQDWGVPYPENGKSITIEIGNDGRQKGDLEIYHPTAVLETGYDILFFWVARMILMSTYALGEVPFKDVYLHGLVRDEQGRKMSKSLGNILDPLDLIPKYGTDAVRLSLLIGTTPGQDMKLSEEKVSGFRNFTNKLWNISRFILMQIGEGSVEELSMRELRPVSDADWWMLAKLHDIESVTMTNIQSYLFSSAGELLRDFTWGDLADWYLEVAKVEKNKEIILAYLLKNLLKMWHPFTPFVTESIWRQAGFSGSLVVSSWPERGEVGLFGQRDPLELSFERVRRFVTDIRRFRSEQGIEPVKFVECVCVASVDMRKVIEENLEVVKSLARIEMLSFVETVPQGWASAMSGSIAIGINVAGVVDVEKEKKKIEKEMSELEAYVASTVQKLKNEEFLAKAPTKVKEDMERKYGEAQAKLAVLKEQYKNVILERS